MNPVPPAKRQHLETRVRIAATACTTPVVCTEFGLQPVIMLPWPMPLKDAQILDTIKDDLCWIVECNVCHVFHRAVPRARVQIPVGTGYVTTDQIRVQRDHRATTHVRDF